MEVSERTNKLENKITKVQADVSYLKGKVDKVEIKLESMDDKTDKLMSELPAVFKEIMQCYVARSEFESFQKFVIEATAEHKIFEKRISTVETKFVIGSAIGGFIILILSFGETLTRWLTSLVHAN
jgi:CII-binding regulator of phage lambda lysogenization HflD